VTSHLKFLQKDLVELVNGKWTFMDIAFHQKIKTA